MKVVLKRYGQDMSKDTRAFRKLRHVVKNKQALRGPHEEPHLLALGPLAP
jgi:hypothetical protein